MLRKLRFLRNLCSHDPNGWCGGIAKVAIIAIVRLGCSGFSVNYRSCRSFRRSTGFNSRKLWHGQPFPQIIHTSRRRRPLMIAPPTTLIR